MTRKLAFQMVVIGGPGGQGHSGIIRELLSGWGPGRGSRVWLRGSLGVKMQGPEPGTFVPSF